MKHQDFVRRNRNYWHLSQEDLRRLLGISQSAVSRLDNGKPPTELHVALALQVVFGHSPRALWNSMYLAIEDRVMREAAVMDRELRGKTDRASRKKLDLLAAMVRRSSNGRETV
jgi:DNA-binding XRE family transcriptional regulator